MMSQERLTVAHFKGDAEKLKSVQKALVVLSESWKTYSPTRNIKTTIWLPYNTEYWEEFCFQNMGTWNTCKILDIKKKKKV